MMKKMFAMIAVLAFAPSQVLSAPAHAAWLGQGQNPIRSSGEPNIELVRARAGGGRAAGARVGSARVHGRRVDRGNVNINRNVHVDRNINVVGGWRRPAAYWWRPGAAVAAGAALGFVTAAAATAWAGTPPDPNYCWYYTDAARTQGFWDACP